MRRMCHICGQQTLDDKPGAFVMSVPLNIPGGDIEIANAHWQACSGCGEEIIPDELSKQGQRTLSRWHAKDFEKEVPAPSTFSAFHCKAGLQRVLLEQRQSEPSDPAFVLRSTAMTSS